MLRCCTARLRSFLALARTPGSRKLLSRAIHKFPQGHFTMADEYEFVEQVKKATYSWCAKLQQKKENEEEPWHPKPPSCKPPPRPVAQAQFKAMERHWSATEYRNQILNQTDSDEEKLKPTPDKPKPTCVKTQVALVSKAQRHQQQKEKDSNRNEGLLQDLQHNCANEKQKEKEKKKKETAKEKEKDKERPIAQWTRPPRAMAHKNQQVARFWIEKTRACQCGAEPVHPHDECNGGAHPKSAPTGPKGRIRLADASDNGPKAESKSEPKAESKKMPKAEPKKRPMPPPKVSLKRRRP